MFEGNFFYFENHHEFLGLQNESIDLAECEEGPGKAGTLLTPTLKRHRFQNFKAVHNRPYVIAYNRFNGDGSYAHSNWPTGFKGKHLIINDATDKIFCYPSYLQWCLESGKMTYVKKNLSWIGQKQYDQWRQKKNRQDWPITDHFGMFSHTLRHGRLHPGTESPPAANIKAYLEMGPVFKDFKDREYDVFFAGQTRSGYMVGNKVDQINALKAAAKKLKLKALIIDKSQNIGRKGYMEAIGNTKYCYNFSIGPLRNRREWEVLLGGGLLVQDWRTKEVIKNIMEPNVHYIWMEENLEQQLERLMDEQKPYEILAYMGWNLAKTCWCQIPTVEFRLFMIYTRTTKRINTLKELMEEEKKQWGELGG